MSEKESELIQHLSAGDKFQLLVTKAGGMAARHAFQEWLQIAIALGMQQELFFAVKEKQLVETIEGLEAEIVESKREEAPSGAQEGTSGNPEPKEGGGGSALEKLRARNNPQPTEGKA